MRRDVKLYLDEDTISRSLVRALRARYVDVLIARDAERMGFSDSEQLEYAALQGRTIFTFNTRDYVRLHTEYLTQGREHAGIIVSDQLQVGVILRRLLKLLDAQLAEDMRCGLEFLGSWR